VCNTSMITEIEKKGNITAQVLMYVYVCSYVLTRN